VVVARGEVLWDPSGEPLSVETRNQERPRLVGDEESGAIVVWEDDRQDSPGIYAQRVLSDGTAAWATNGISLSGHGGVYWPELVADGAGGAIVTWIDERAGNRDVYAQRVSSDGTVAWTTGGISVCAAPGDQYVHSIAPDGAGGAIVAWDDFGRADADVYAQRVLSDGTAAWATGGVSLTARSGDQGWPVVTSDGAGGAIVVWHGGCGGVTSICAQRVRPDGTAAWVEGGVPLSGGGGGWPVVGSDGAGGALVVWQDQRAGEYNVDLYAQRVLSDGTTAWAAEGMALTRAGGSQWFAAIASDGTGGALVAWQDERTGHARIYAQRVLSDGTAAWATDGVWVSTETTRGYSPDILADGAGGAWVVWRSMNVHVQRLRPDGTARWTGTLLVCDVDEGAGQRHPRLVGDGAGGALVAWEDDRRWYHGDNYDIYAQRIGEVSYRYYFPAVFEN